MISALVAGAGLAGCHKQAAQVASLPLDTGAAQPMGEAPAPAALPPAPPAQIAAPASYGDAYAYPDRAWGMSWAFGDSPPDYAFDDDGVTPWVWIADDDSEFLVEPVPGGERYYYFEPGAYTPFYVQDPTYGYGFANGALVAIYNRSGREIAPSANPSAAATAGQYLARGRMLRQAAASQPHQAVAAANWTARRGLIAAQAANLARAAQTNPAWGAYHDQHAAQVQGHFASEAARRETWAAQTDARIGEPARAQREQRLAKSVAPGASVPPNRAPAPGVTAPPRYASATPTRPAAGAARTRTAPRRAARPTAEAARGPRPAHAAPPRALAQARTQPPGPAARSATAHGREAAYQSRLARPARRAAAHPAPAAHRGGPDRNRGH